MISLKNNMRLPLLLMGVIMLALLSFLSALARLKDYRDLIMVVPRDQAALAYHTGEIEKVCREGLDVTYEIKDTVSAEGAGTVLPVTRIKTNPAYRRVLGLHIVRGDFFGGAAQTAGSHHAVLSETAAFWLFGSYDIVGSTVILNGERFLITGIVNDQAKEEAAVYIPADISADGSADMVPVMLLRTDSSIGEIRNQLTRVGVYEANTRFLNLAVMSNLYRQLLAVAVGLYLFLPLAIFAGKRIDCIKGVWAVFKLRRKIMYLPEAVMKSRGDLRQALCQMALLAAAVWAAGWIAKTILMAMLPWKDLLESFRYLSDAYFSARISWLCRYFYCGPVLFGLLLLILAALIVLHLKRMINLGD